MKTFQKILLMVLAAASFCSCNKDQPATLDNALAGTLNKRLLQFTLKGGLIPPDASTGAVIAAINDGVSSENIKIPVGYDHNPPMTITNKRVIVFDHEKQTFIYPDNDKTEK